MSEIEHGTLIPVQIEKASKTLRQLKRVIRQINYIKYKMLKESIIARKRDTRHKIMMGGLIIKAGLTELYDTNPAIILGLLVEAKSKTSDIKKLAEWQALGMGEMTQTT